MSDVRTRLLLDQGNVTVHSFQDVEDIIERNKQLASQGKQRGDFRHTATIPNNILLQWLNETGVRWGSPEFDEVIKRKLNDPAWAKLRVDR